MIIEWGAHMFSRDGRRFPFHPQATYTPDDSQLLDDPLAVYLEYMRREGVDRAVLVQPEPYGDDHALLLECLAREPERLRVVSSRLSSVNRPPSGSARAAINRFWKCEWGCVLVNQLASSRSMSGISSPVSRSSSSRCLAFCVARSISSRLGPRCGASSLVRSSAASTRSRSSGSNGTSK